MADRGSELSLCMRALMILDVVIPRRARRLAMLVPARPVVCEAIF